MVDKKKTLDLVDPELRPVLDAFTGFDVDETTLFTLRALPTSPPLDDPAFDEVFVQRPGSNGDLRLLIIDPFPNMRRELKPALLYMHGGGFVFGSPETILPTMQCLAKDVGCVIILPAYRLAPEFPFPAALDDNYLALNWIHNQAEELHIDPSRIAIGGDSAGGGHAAVLNIAVRERGEFSPVFQILLYPMLDDRTGSAQPVSTQTGEFIWTKENNVFGWSSYLGCPAGAETISEGAVPARNVDLSELPPTLIATGSLDLFAQENIAYGKRLLGQGVDVHVQIFEGAYHGFNVIMPEAKISRRFHELCVTGLKSAFKV